MDPETKAAIESLRETQRRHGHEIREERQERSDAVKLIDERFDEVIGIMRRQSGWFKGFGVALFLILALLGYIWNTNQATAASERADLEEKIEKMEAGMAGVASTARKALTEILSWKPFATKWGDDLGEKIKNNGAQSKERHDRQEKRIDRIETQVERCCGQRRKEE